MAHLVAQYGATSGDVDRPHPELRLTITPEPRATIAGTKWRMTLATPLMFTSITRSNSAADTSQSGRVAVDQRGVVDEQVGRPVLGDDAVGPGLHRQVVRHVQLGEVVRRPRRRAQVRDRLGRAAAADHPMAGPRQALGQRPAQPLRHPRDHDDPTLRRPVAFAMRSTSRLRASDGDPPDPMIIGPRTARLLPGPDSCRRDRESWYAEELEDRRVSP